MMTRKKSFKLWGAKALVPALVFAGMCSLAKGDVITQYTAGAVTDTTAPETMGESFTTPAVGGPWNNIAINFYGPGLTPLAAGNGYLFTQPFTGDATTITSSTLGFFASTSTIAGDVWLFDPSVVLSANTTYWFYEDAPITVIGDGFAGTDNTEMAYFGSDNFVPCEDCAIPIADFTVASVPEPSTWLSGLTGLAVLGALRLRGRKSARRS